MNNSPLVSIICTSYNHEAYIKDALEGFVMQKTNFPFEIIVHDDASTDNTANLVKSYESKYPELFANIYQTENQYSKGKGDVGRIVFGAARGKYIALCEGDDYWTDPFKLQKQVDFLEANPEYGLAYTEIDRFHEGLGIIENEAFKNKLGIHPNTFEDFILNAWFIAPCTWVFRKSLIGVSFKYLSGPGDYQLLLQISSKSKIKFFPDSSSIYRISEESMSHFKSEQANYLFRKSVFEIQLSFAYKYLYQATNELKIKFYTNNFKHICEFEKIDFVNVAFEFISQANRASLKIRLLYQIKKYGLFNFFIKIAYHLISKVHFRKAYISNIVLFEF